MHICVRCNTYFGVTQVEGDALRAEALAPSEMPASSVSELELQIQQHQAVKDGRFHVA